jgi:hypothetical protein
VIALLEVIDATLDPSDPAHMQFRDMIARSRELTAQLSQLHAEALRMAHAGDIEGAQSIVSKCDDIVEELKANEKRTSHIARHLRPSTETMQ